MLKVCCFSLLFCKLVGFLVLGFHIRRFLKIFIQEEEKQSSKRDIYEYIYILKGLYRKNERGYQITLALDRYPLKLYLMFISGEIDIKLCQIYMKIHMHIYIFV